jgi:hypothetical protein
MNKNIYIRISEFAEKRFDGFIKEEIFQYLHPLQDWEEEIIITNLQNAWYNKRGLLQYQQETMFQCIKLNQNDINQSKFILNPSSYFEYFDYLELQTATKNANEAHRQSNLATWIAIISLFISIIVSGMQIFMEFLPYII